VKEGRVNIMNIAPITVKGVGIEADGIFDADSLI
jgi:hypothetical protein